MQQGRQWVLTLGNPAGCHPADATITACILIAQQVPARQVYAAHASKNCKVIGLHEVICCRSGRMMRPCMCRAVTATGSGQARAACHERGELGRRLWQQRFPDSKLHPAIQRKRRLTSRPAPPHLTHLGSWAPGLRPLPAHVGQAAGRVMVASSL